MQCSVVRNTKNDKIELTNGYLEKDILENTKKQNITTNGFFILKAEIEIFTKTGIEKFLGSIKYEKPDKYLISIKSRTGIEVARVFISNDTILVNDRINRKQYYGSHDYLKNKYGITNSVIPLALGDFMEDSMFNISPMKCFDNRLDFHCTLEGIKINYVIDCKKNKAILAICEDSKDGNNVKIQYDDFFKTGNILFPGKIKIIDLRSTTTIGMKIKKIESAWNGNIEFIPGKKYELIRLL